MLKPSFQTQAAEYSGMFQDRFRNVEAADTAKAAETLFQQHTTQENAPLFEQAEVWMIRLRDAICAMLESLEDGAQFERRTWHRQEAMPIKGGNGVSVDPGGGVSSSIRGQVFEKGGVNVSSVQGTIAPKFRREVAGAEESEGWFRATGLSLVIHPKNPHVPPIHMNTRIVETSKTWFGGGIDLNPIFPNTEDTSFFKNELRAICEESLAAANHYERFARNCDEYFHIAHRGESRGIGGIFFDHFGIENPKSLPGIFEFIKRLGAGFIPIYHTLVVCSKDRPWGVEEEQTQRIRRGRYVEFNLIYDRGTRFGLMTGADSEAVLMSLPPTASWP